MTDKVTVHIFVFKLFRELSVDFMKTTKIMNGKSDTARLD